MIILAYKKNAIVESSSMVWTNTETDILLGSLSFFGQVFWLRLVLQSLKFGMDCI